MRYKILILTVYVIIASSTIINAFSPDSVAIRYMGTIKPQRVYKVDVLAWIGYYATPEGIADEQQVIAHTDKIRWVTVFGDNFNLFGTTDCTDTVHQELIDAAKHNNMSLLMRCGVGIPGAADAILTTPEMRDTLIDRIINHPRKDVFDGIILNIEGVSDAYEEEFIEFVSLLKAGLGTKLLGVFVPAKEDETINLAYDYARLGAVADMIIPQCFFDSSVEDMPAFQRSIIRYALSVMPKAKFIPCFSLADPLADVKVRMDIAVNEFNLTKISIFRVDLSTDEFWNLIEPRSTLS